MAKATHTTIEITDALRFLAFASDPTASNIIHIAIEEIRRLRQVEQAARTLADLVTAEDTAFLSVPNGEHELIQIIRGQL